MNRAIFQQAQNAYDNKDFAQALNLFNAVVSDANNPLQPGEYGHVYHQIGNCLVKLNNYDDAINAYSNATTDNSYVSIGTVYYNLGMAYAYMNDFGNAISNFQTAINVPNYRSKYKAYTAMGNALMKSGKPAEAGAVFRSAALDDRNPDPTRALLNLGVCFMALNRSDDAIIVYENAFQFNMPDDLRNRLYANLGQAYVASGQMQKAVSAFENAIRDKSYVLSDSASVDYQRAIAAVSKGNESVDLKTEGFNAAKASGLAVGAAAGVAAGASKAQAQESAPQDNMAGFNANNYNGQNDVDQGAFATNENYDFANNANDAEFDKWSQSAQEAAYNPKKKKHPVKVVIVVILCLLAAAIIAGSVLFVFGFGFPTQEMVVKDYFSNPTEAKDKVFADKLSQNKKDAYSAMVSQDSSPVINGVDRSVNDSTVYVTGKSSKGGEIQYKIKMTRDLVGWKIISVDFAYASTS